MNLGASILTPTVFALPACHSLTSSIKRIKIHIFKSRFKILTLLASYSCSSWPSLKSFTLPSERLSMNIAVSQVLILPGVELSSPLWASDLKKRGIYSSTGWLRKMLFYLYLDSQKNSSKYDIELPFFELYPNKLYVDEKKFLQWKTNNIAAQAKTDLKTHSIASCPIANCLSFLWRAWR